MPNFSGIETSEINWEEFLKKFGTGHFDKTYLLCNANEGINEMELYFLRHLVHHKRLKLVFLYIWLNCFH